MSTIPMIEVYSLVADAFASTGNTTPTHCDVRCAVNDMLDSLSRDGHAVRSDYSQDRAFRVVRGLLAWRAAQ
jgi:hypothetical protein